MAGAWQLFWALALALTSGGNLFAGVTIAPREEFRQTYLLDPHGRILLENPYGDVRITAWDRDEVRVEAIKTGTASARPSDARIVVETTSGRVAIRTLYAGAGQHPASVEYRISAPRTAVLENVRLVNGGLSISGFEGSVKASAVNGNIKAEKLGGQVELSTVNGWVEADFQRVSRAKPITVTSVNGPIRVSLPSGAAASLEAHNLSGGIESDIVRVWRAPDGHQLKAVLNRGGAPIQLRNINGGISIRSTWSRNRAKPAS